MARNPDYVRSHMSLTKRVRNLETGVHPTTGELTYYDSFGLTTFPVVAASEWKVYDPGGGAFPPRWQRRMGVAMLDGAVQSKVEAPANNQHAATLPAEARPLTSMFFVVATEFAPYTTRVRVTTAGEVFIYNDGLQVGPGGGTGAYPVVYFDGVHFPVN